MSMPMRKERPPLPPPPEPPTLQELHNEDARVRRGPHADLTAGDLSLEGEEREMSIEELMGDFGPRGAKRK